MYHQLSFVHPSLDSVLCCCCCTSVCSITAILCQIM